MTDAMAIEAGVRRAMIAALEADAALGAAINGVFEPGAAGISAPYVTVAGTIARDWGSKDRAGREIIATIELYDARREGDAAADLAGLAVAAVLGMARTIDGAEIGSVRLRKSQLRRAKTGEWIATIDFQVRALAV